MPRIALLVCLFLFSQTNAQEVLPDSSKLLDEVIVTGYETNKPLIQTAAAVSLIRPKDITRFENTTLLNAFMPFPGIRMEERSPGSYRISIRGSSVRSPFGVRNVKVYWNDIPLSDANGITYFNLLDMTNLRSIEVLKGPAGSMYGASTGGVLLLKSQAGETHTANWGSLKTNVLVGQYGTLNHTYAYTLVNEKVNTVISYARSQADGYREHSAVRRDVLNTRSSIVYGKSSTLHLLFNYSTIDYQTPGGLTIEQVAENRRQARPATRFTPSAIEQQAGIKQQMLLTGISNEWKISPKWLNTISFFSTNSHLENPFITNYEIRSEQSAGGRTRFSYTTTMGKILLTSQLGSEWIFTGSTFETYLNNKGLLGTPISQEAVQAIQGVVFGQFELVFKHHWTATIGGSFNKQKYHYDRRSDAPNQLIINDNVGVPFSPRIAILKEFEKQTSIYASIGKGFSPPTVQEFVAGYTTNQQFKTVSAENGINYEVGFRKFSFLNHFNIDVSAYSMNLTNTIVRRLDANEKERFTNAGKTAQKGIEASISANAIKSSTLLVELMGSYTFAYFKYLDYQVLNTDFSGKFLPSVPMNMASFGVDFVHTKGFYATAISQFTDKIYLNDANTASANAYWILNTRMGWKFKISGIECKSFIGAENLLNQAYSLGNDTNAFGNRFYNPAASRNFNIGFSLKL